MKTNLRLLLRALSPTYPFMITSFYNEIKKLERKINICYQNKSLYQEPMKKCPCYGTISFTVRL